MDAQPAELAGHGRTGTVPYPARFQQNDDILHIPAMAWDHGYAAALDAPPSDEHRPPNPYGKTADASTWTVG